MDYFLPLGIEHIGQPADTGSTAHTRTAERAAPTPDAEGVYQRNHYSNSVLLTTAQTPKIGACNRYQTKQKEHNLSLKRDAIILLKVRHNQLLREIPRRGSDGIDPYSFT